MVRKHPRNFSIERILCCIPGDPPIYPPPSPPLTAVVVVALKCALVYLIVSIFLSISVKCISYLAVSNPRLAPFSQIRLTFAISALWRGYRITIPLESHLLLSGSIQAICLIGSLGEERERDNARLDCFTFCFYHTATCK